MYTSYYRPSTKEKNLVRYALAYVGLPVVVTVAVLQCVVAPWIQRNMMMTMMINMVNVDVERGESNSDNVGDSSHNRMGVMVVVLSTLVLLGSVTTLQCGWRAMTYVVKTIVRRVKKMWRRRKHNHNDNTNNNDNSNSWAIVTGATSGIGEAFCHELVSLAGSGIGGMNNDNVLLISRNENKLQATQLALLERVRAMSSDGMQHRQGGIHIEYLVRDFADSSDKATEDFQVSLEKRLASILASDGGRGRIGLLIHCVGVVNDIPATFGDTQANDIDEMLQINVKGTFSMTSTVLPFMMKQQQQQSPTRSAPAILTVSSGGCNHPTPLLATYTATKAFGHALSQGMHHYYSSQFGIDVLCIRPYYFQSNMMMMMMMMMMCSSQNRTGASTSGSSGSGSILVPEARVIARLALEALSRGDTDVAPYWVHALGALLAKWTPRDPAYRILWSLQQARKRSLVKKETFAMQQQQQQLRNKQGQLTWTTELDCTVRMSPMDVHSNGNN
jgi:17beta-estradiol 17-dehydrogenase / very-long-chain 3-oxoacyl-CoA reductase